MTGAVCLTFDDLFVDSWCATRPLLKKFGVRATFCISRIHTATAQQIAGLHLLQDDGHEIAFHSRTHARPAIHLRKHGLDHWTAHEIDEGVEEHRAFGFPAKSFASPYHGSTPETRRETAKRFAVTRAAGPRNLQEDQIADRIYTAPKPDGSVDCLGFCDFQHKIFPGWDWQNMLLDRIASEGGTGVFVGHDIRTQKSGRGSYSVRRQLRRFLKETQARGLTFKTLSEIAQA